MTGDERAAGPRRSEPDDPPQPEELPWPAGAPRLLGVVLAGGKSSRMGSDKANLPHPGRLAVTAPIATGDQAARANDSGCSYLQYAIARLLPLVDQVAVAGRQWPGAAGDSSPLAVGDPVVLAIAASATRVTGLRDEVAGLGPAMGVATSLRYAAAHGLGGALVTPVDMPQLRTQHLQSLAQAWYQHQKIVCATFGGGIAEPLLAIYPVAALAGVEQVITSPRRSLSQWLKSVPVELISLPPAVGKNVNRPEDR